MRKINRIGRVLRKIAETKTMSSASSVERRDTSRTSAQQRQIIKLEVMEVSHGIVLFWSRAMRQEVEQKREKHAQISRCNKYSE